jgi:O-antigen ligase
VVPRTLRRRIDQASLPLMTRLSSLPRLVPFLILLALLISGMLIGGLGGFVLMGLAALFVGWVLYLSWPLLNRSERIMRFAVLLLAIALAVVQLSPGN